MTGLGIGLLLAGVVLLVAEAHIAAGGLLGTLGVAAAVGGTVVAVDGAGGGVVLGLVLAALVALMGGGALLLAARAVGRSTARLARGGRDPLIGARGRAREPFGDDGGRVLVEGELWQAHNADPDEPVVAGDPIVVERIDGLTLTVRRAEPWELHP
jgi:membrane-bound serine protease (ClpP class)